MFLYLFLLIISFNAFAFESILKLNQEINFKPKEQPFHSFIFSTELNLASAKPILEKAPPGLLITVGSERGFNVAALAKDATYVLMVDFSENIVRYNQINIQLLKASDLKEYRKLRWEADLKEWQKLKLSKDDFLWWKKNVREAKGIWNNLSENLSRYGKDIFYERFTSIYNTLARYNQLNKVQREVIVYPTNFTDWKSRGINLSENDFKWWQENVTNNKERSPWMASGGSLIGAPDYNQIIFDWSSILDNKSGNFIINEDLYNRLHKLAIENRIAVCRLDLTNAEHKSKLTQAIEKSKIPISLLDLDNTWYYEYTGRADNYHNLINQLLPYGQDNSILMVMTNQDVARFMQYQFYFGFAFSNIKTWDNDFRMSRFVTQSQSIWPLLQGRIFYGQNMPKWEMLNF